MWPTSQIFGRCVVAAKNPRQIALTFDDGPNDPDTHRLLEVLAKHGVRATFFMIGRFVRQRPEIAAQWPRRAFDRQPHMTHPLLLIRPPKVVRQELRDCNDALEDALGLPVRWFADPMADVDRMYCAPLRTRAYAVMWNAMGFDWSRPTRTRSSRIFCAAFGGMCVAETPRTLCCTMAGSRDGPGSPPYRHCN